MSLHLEGDQSFFKNAASLFKKFCNFQVKSQLWGMERLMPIRECLGDLGFVDVALPG